MTVQAISRLILIASAALFFACGGDKPKILHDQEEISLEVSAIGELGKYTEPGKFHQGVGVHARGEGSNIVISVKNLRDKTLNVIHTDFAVIKGPNPQDDLILINPTTAAVKQFTPLILKKGEQGVTVLRMRNFPEVSGMKLVYNNPRLEILFPISIE